MTRKPKAIQPWVVGTWYEVGSEHNPCKNEITGEDAVSFVPLDKQPEEPITDLNKMVAWVKQNIGEPGTYEFVRRATGRLTIVQQTVMKAVLE